jgi:hypothetical protein
MMKNIAVMLRGHVRTWYFNYPAVFEFYDSIAENVDYYFITYDNSNHAGIEKTFKGKNLITLQIYPHDFDTKKWYNSWYGAAVMSTFLIPWRKRREKETGKSYDAVFDTRPDVYPIRKIDLDNPKNYIPSLPPEQNCIYSPGLEIHTNLSKNGHREGLPEIAIRDWFLMMRPEVYDTMANRYINDYRVYTDGKSPGAQIEYIEIAQTQGFYLCTTDWIDTAMTRPNIFTLDWKQSRDWTDIVCASGNTWTNLSRDEKINLCLKYGVKVTDYSDTKSATCKI